VLTNTSPVSPLRWVSKQGSSNIPSCWHFRWSQRHRRQHLWTADSIPKYSSVSACNWRLGNWVWRGWVSGTQYFITTTCLPQGLRSAMQHHIEKTGGLFRMLFCWRFGSAVHWYWQSTIIRSVARGIIYWSAIVGGWQTTQSTITLIKRPSTILTLLRSFCVRFFVFLFPTWQISAESSLWFCHFSS